MQRGWILSRVCAVVWLAGLGVSAPAAREGVAAEDGLAAVVAAYARSQGGREKAVALASYVEIGWLDAGGIEMVRIVYAQAPRCLRIEVIAAEGRLVQGTDGLAVWSYVQKPGGKRELLALPVETERAVRQLAQQACVDPILEPGRLGCELALRDDRPEAEGEHLVEVSEAGRSLFYLRIDRATGWPLARWSAATPKTVQHYRGRREVDGGVWPSELAFSTDGKETGRWRLADVRLNEPLDGALFAPPREQRPAGVAFNR